MTKRPFKPGDRVIYVPLHAHGERSHPDCEHGKVSSLNERTGDVFVKFDGAVGRLGWDGATAQCCDPESLEHE